MQREKLEPLFGRHGCGDWKWTDPRSIIVAQRVRMKCTYGCANYGRCASCPPNTPSIAESRRFFDEYESGAVMHFAKSVARPEDRHAWSRGVNRELLELEREVFLAGYPKAFLLFMDSCPLCDECAATRDQCRQPRLARPSPEAMGVDVFATVRQYGYPIQVLSDYTQAMNRYAFLLIE